MEFIYKNTGKQAMGEFKYVVLFRGEPRYCHRLTEVKEYTFREPVSSVVYKWNKDSREYKELV